MGIKSSKPWIDQVKKNINDNDIIKLNKILKISSDDLRNIEFNNENHLYFYNSNLLNEKIFIKFGTSLINSEVINIIPWKKFFKYRIEKKKYRKIKTYYIKKNNIKIIDVFYMHHQEDEKTNYKILMFII